MASGLTEGAAADAWGGPPYLDMVSVGGEFSDGEYTTVVV
jgi:hypothetical protein